jgi:hypothetical protein
MPLDENQRKEVEKRIHRSAAFQRVFSGSDGKLTLDEIDMLCGYKRDTFHADPYEHAYNAGRRSAAVFIHNVIEQDVEKAMRLLDAGDKTERKSE